MPRLTLRITDEMYEAIQSLAASQEDTLSTIAKQLIGRGLDRSIPHVDNSTSHLQEKISLEGLFLLKKLMYEHFDYSETDFDKVKGIVKKKIEATE